MLLERLPSLRSIDFTPVTDAERPRDVERISAKKVAKGEISAEEYEHIMKVHRLLASLDHESNDLLASSDEESEEEDWDEHESTDDDDESLPPDPSPEADPDSLSPLSGATRKQHRRKRSTPSPKSRLPELSKLDSLNVFTKVVAADMLHNGAAASSFRGPAPPQRHTQPAAGGESASGGGADGGGRVVEEGIYDIPEVTSPGVPAPHPANNEEVPFLFRKISNVSTDSAPAQPATATSGSTKRGSSEAPDAEETRGREPESEPTGPPEYMLAAGADTRPQKFHTDADGYEIPSPHAFTTDPAGLVHPPTPVPSFLPSWATGPLRPM